MSIWDTPIQAEAQQGDRDFPVLAPGVYEFEVTDATGKEYKAKPGGKIGNCAQISVRLRCESKEADVNVFEELFSDPKMAWKMEAFCKCIGIYRKGITPGEVIKEAAGNIGKCELYVDEYNGKKRNKVRKWIEKPAASKPARGNSDDLPF